MNRNWSPRKGNERQVYHKISSQSSAAKLKREGNAVRLLLRWFERLWEVDPVPDRSSIVRERDKRPWEIIVVKTCCWSRICRWENDSWWLKADSLRINRLGMGFSLHLVSLISWRAIFWRVTRRTDQKIVDQPSRFKRECKEKDSWLMFYVSLLLPVRFWIQGALLIRFRVWAR